MKKEDVYLWMLLLLFSGCGLPSTEKEFAAPAPNLGQNERLTVVTTDTAFINKTYTNAYPLIDQFTDSAIEQYQQTLLWSKQIGYHSGVASSYNNLAYCYSNKNDFHKANQLYREGTTYIQHALLRTSLMGQTPIVRNLYPKLLSFYSNQNDHEAIVRVYQQAYLHYNPKDSLQLSQLTQLQSSAASAYFYLGQYDSASSIYLKILHSYPQPDTHNYSLILYSYLGLGSIESRMGNPKKALNYFHQAAANAEHFKDSSLLLKALNNIGTHYLEHEDYVQSEKYAQKALNLAGHVNSTTLKTPAMAHSAFTIAAALMEQDRPEDAIVYSRMVWRFAQITEKKKDQALANYLLGANLMRLNRAEKAIPYLQTSLQLSEELKESNTLLASYEQLSEAYAAAGKYQNAFEHKSRYGQLKDSLRGAEVAGRIAEVNTKYDLAEKDRLLVQNQLQITNQQLKIKNQYILVGIILAATFFAVLIFTFILRKRKHRAEIDRLRSHIAGEEQEKNRMARELHDGIVSWLSIIKTNLSNLPEPVLESEMEQRLNVINQLDQGIDELRTTSHNLLPEILTQAGLLGALRHFCHKINQTKSLDITFQHFGALPSLTDDSQLNIYRIVQELVSNIIKHAKATTVLIQFLVRNTQLEITIDDNGSRQEGERHGSSSGIGLYNLHHRLQLLGGSMEIENRDGTSVYLTFELSPFIINPHEHQSDNS